MLLLAGVLIASTTLFILQDASGEQRAGSASLDQGTAIMAKGAKIALKNNCFVGNNFSGNGAVLLDRTASPFEDGRLYYSDGNFVSQAGNEHLKCSFGYYDDETDECTMCGCIPLEASKCGLEWYTDVLMTNMSEEESSENLDVFGNE